MQKVDIFLKGIAISNLECEHTLRAGERLTSHAKDCHWDVCKAVIVSNHGGGLFGPFVDVRVP